MPECRKCGVELVVGENWWASYAKAYDYICIPCRKAYDRQRRRENPDYKRPLIVCKECGEEKLHAGHGLCKTCYNRQWREQNPDHDYERPLITCKECGEEKPHEARGLCQACYHRQYEAPLIICKECGEEKPHCADGLCHACYERQWDKDNADKKRAYTRRYRARKANATIEPVDEATIYELYGYICIYCGSTENLELDHVVPLTGGGAHCEDNLVVACRSCNASKHDRPLEKWLQTRPDLRAWVM